MVKGKKYSPSGPSFAGVKTESQDPLSISSTICLYFSYIPIFE